MKTPDAIQLAVAIQAGCDAFLCNDASAARPTRAEALVYDATYRSVGTISEVAWERSQPLQSRAKIF